MSTSTVNAPSRFNSRPTLPAIATDARCVIKRDGTSVPWDAAKITRAIALAFHDVQQSGPDNPARDNPAARFGVDLATYRKAPREAVVTEEDAAKWNRLHYHAVDYTRLAEQSDETTLKEVVACAGGACELS